MSAAIDSGAPGAACAAARILRAPFDGYAAERLLAHFEARDGVAYFPVVDPLEGSRARADEVMEGIFDFNGERHRLAEPIDWLRNASDDVEWHILLHKFYYATALGRAYHETGDARYRDRWAALTDAWIGVTPPGFIAADVTGRRIQNWIYAHHYFVGGGRPARESSALCPSFHRRFLCSLHDQVEWLAGALAPARNHRTLELHAIFLAAVVFPEWRASAGWRDFALAELAANAASDVLDDGVQCELSTDYHHLVLRNLLAVRRLARMNAIAVPAALDAAINRALDFSLHVHQPAGVVPAFSDGDVHDYRDLLAQGAELYGRADLDYVASGGLRGHRPAARARGFAAGGYYVVRSGWGEEIPFADEQHLVIDCGPLGAGNHGHFDCLSFELAAFGGPLVVDPGRYTYDEAGATNWRARFRGTASHNTVLVDGLDQTRYEPGPRKMKVRGAGPEARVHAWMNGSEFDFFHGEARSGVYPVAHQRALLFVRPEYWLLADFMLARTSHRYDQFFHLAPIARGRTALTRRTDAVLIDAPHLLLAQAATSGLEVSLDDGFVSRRYGEREPAPVVRFSRTAAHAGMHAVLIPYREQAPRIAMRTLPVLAESGDPLASIAQAISIRFGSGRDAYTDTWFVRPQGLAGICRFGGFRTDGAFAFVREDAFGGVLRVHADPAGRLEEGGFPVRACDPPSTHRPPAASDAYHAGVRS